MAYWLTISTAQSTNEAGNTSTVSATLYLNSNYGSSWWGTNIGGNINIGGSVSGFSRSSGGSSSGNWSAAIHSHSYTWNHGPSGYRGAVGISGAFGPGSNVPSLSVSGGEYGAIDWNRSANTPSFSEITRTSTTNFRVNYNLTGSVNGPTTYVVQRSTNNWGANETSWTNPGRPFDATVSANQEYYFRIYAYGDEGGNKFSSVLGPYWGQPTPPQSPSAATNANTSGAVNVWWTAPSNQQSGVDYYHIYRNGPVGTGTYVGQWNGATPPTSGAPFYDNGATPRSTNTYYIYAHTPQYWSEVSVVSNSAVAASVPSIPGMPTIKSKIGRNVTINSTRGSNGYNNAISEYRIQLSTDAGATWKGWNSSTKSFTANGTYNVLDSNGDFFYELLTPALTYRWRIYAVNSVGTGDIATMSTGTFLSSGGRRWTGSAWEPTQTAKRWDPILNSGNGGWVDLSIAKRWDPSLNGGNGGWADLS